MLLSDTGGGYYEGSTDITRTTVLGHITPELKNITQLCTEQCST